jgi:nicotinamide-nucleotide amidase
MITEIITIGDELLVGQVVNTNASWMAQQLHAAGIGVSRIVAVSDTQAEIIDAIDKALTRADVILMTGGLGPTKDDITKTTLCHYFNTRLVFHEPSYRMIEKFFELRGYTVTERNRQQAELPEMCTPIPNPHGTAPGMLFEKDGKTIISMPGVPFEMQSMMEEQVLPMLAKKGNSRIVVHRTVLTHGVGESFLTEMIREWEDNLPENIKLAYLPQPGIVRLRLSGAGDERQAVAEQISREIQQLQKLIPELIFGFEHDTMEEVVGKLLRERKQSISTAESCTGGYLAHLITSVPGASDYYPGSIISYANEIKEEYLGVKAVTLASYGAVSEPTVIEMALGARKRFRTTNALAISGIAGPEGGTAEKPVGTVWIALAHPKGTVTKKYMFGEHRGRNIRRSALAALNILRLHLLS